MVTEKTTDTIYDSGKSNVDVTKCRLNSPKNQATNATCKSRTSLVPKVNSNTVDGSSRSNRREHKSFPLSSIGEKGGSTGAHNRLNRTSHNLESKMGPNILKSGNKKEKSNSNEISKSRNTFDGSVRINKREHKSFPMSNIGEKGASTYTNNQSNSTSQSLKSKMGQAIFKSDSNKEKVDCNEITKFKRITWNSNNDTFSKENRASLLRKAKSKAV